MKNKFLLAYALFITMLLQCACSGAHEEVAQLELIPCEVVVKYGTNNAVVPYANVTLLNNDNGQKIEQTTDDKGKLVLSRVLPGNYEIRVHKKLNKEEYKALFNQELLQDEVLFNGILSSTLINKENDRKEVSLILGKTSPFIIKQIYYAGSDIVTGATIRDQFIEFYNNSDQPFLLENICFAQIEGKRNRRITPYTLSNGQYDWSKGEGQEGDIGQKANTDYVYAITIFRIPNEGKSVAPGESIVVAATAINHKAPFTDNEGNEETVIDPSLTVDLSKADYEAYLGDWWIEKGWEPYFYDIQNPEIKDLEVDYFEFGRDMLFDPHGRDAFVLFQASKEEVKQYKKIYTPGDPEDGLFVRIPKTAVLDGVDLTVDGTSSLIPKKLPIDMDASQTFVELGGYSSQSVIRKTKEIKNGRIILQDTNSSIEDFVSQKAEPKSFQN